MISQPSTGRRRLREVAQHQHGYFTARDAAELGISRDSLKSLIRAGGIASMVRGVYRFDPADIPLSGLDGYMEAVLAAGPGAFLYADAVLGLHDLALVNPSRIRVGTPRRVRKVLPPTIEVVRVRVPPDELETHEGIPCTTVARALTDSIGIVMIDRLITAAEEAAERGLLRRRERERVLAMLGGARGAR